MGEAAPDERYFPACAAAEGLGRWTLAVLLKEPDFRCHSLTSRWPGKLVWICRRCGRPPQSRRLSLTWILRKAG